MTDFTIRTTAAPHTVVAECTVADDLTGEILCRNPDRPEDGSLQQRFGSIADLRQRVADLSAFTPLEIHDDPWADDAP